MLQRSLRGGVAGAVATVVMTLEQPLDKRLFDFKYDDVEILGKLVRGGLAADGGVRPLPPCPQGAAEARRKPPSLRPGDDPPRSVRHRPRAPRGRAQPPQRIAHVVAGRSRLLREAAQGHRPRWPIMPFGADRHRGYS